MILQTSLIALQNSFHKWQTAVDKRTKKGREEGREGGREGGRKGGRREGGGRREERRGRREEGGRKGGRKEEGAEKMEKWKNTSTHGNIKYLVTKKNTSSLPLQ